MKLTGLQRQLLGALEAEHPNPMRVGGDSEFSARVARSLEARGLINLDRGDYCDLMATWDDEAHADFVRQLESNLDEVYP